MPKTLTELTASEALTEMDAGRLTSESLVAACLARIAERDAAVAAWASVDPQRALAAARAADTARASGIKQGPLAGIPVGIKDIIDTADYPTELGSQVFAGRQPDQDAAVVTALKSAGAIVLGKTVTTEFAFFGPGKTKNPRDPSRTPGGSSSGSAAAVADLQAPLALGTQTAGSMIRPASYCGVIGYKPTFGYTSLAGVLEQSKPLDTMGGYARSIPDIALLFDVLGSTAGKSPSLAAAIAEPLSRVPRLAFIRTPAWPQAEPATRAAFELFANNFGTRAEIFEIALSPEFDGILRLQQIVQFSDIARNYGPIADANPDRVSSKLKEIIAEGRTFSSADYVAAQAEADQLYESLTAVLDGYDAILTPAATGPALLGLTSIGSPAFNGLWTYLEMPCISLPLLEVDGMPVGVQIVGRRADDGSLLRIANWIMQQA